MTETTYEISPDEIADLPDHFKTSYAKATEEIERYKIRLAEVEAQIAAKGEDPEVKRSNAELIAKFKAESEQRSLALHRENVAMKFNIPVQHAHRLRGTTREELEADALDLASLFD